METGCWRMATAVVLLSLLLSHLTGEANAQERKPYLEILPHGEVQSKPIDSSIVLQCKPKVADPKLISNIQWIDPHNKPIENRSNYPGSSKPTMYTEINDDRGLSLFFNSLKEEQAGQYICKAQYANTELITNKVTIETIIAITWDDAPENQYAILGQDYSIKCQVRARPSPTVDWLYNDEVMKTNDRYIIETDALRIKNVQESDDGIYTCRAYVPQTGELQTRNIRVEVMIKPTIQEIKEPVEVIEGEAANIECIGKGKPPPKFSWIKTISKEDLANADRFGVNQDTGVLTITNVRQEDDGEYQCTATNLADMAIMNIQLNIIVKPKIKEFANQTVIQGKKAKLTCTAIGRPPPTINFRKHTSDKAYKIGVQAEDDRIILSNNVDDTKGETIGELTIDRTLRSNDGLYECIANNKGGTAFKNGHLMVEFPPSFASMSNRTIWSWDSRPVNLTCIAESIPNATISWTYYGDQKIENDPRITIINNGPISTLQIIPVDLRYYTSYKCIARNMHGEAFHILDLKQAPKPAQVQQVSMKETTATTITFEIVPPDTIVDLPIQTITVQYRKKDETWAVARNRTWVVGPHATYVVENLEPQTYYDFRFAASNEAGRGNWAMDKSFSTTSRSVPGLVRFFPSPEKEYIQSHFYDKYNLKWSTAPDNGVRVDFYEIKWCTVKKFTEQWELQENTCQIKQETKHETWIDNMYPDTYYKVELKAHNLLGFGTPANITIKTARKSEGLVVDPRFSSNGVSIQLAVNVFVSTLMILCIIV